MNGLMYRGWKKVYQAILGCMAILFTLAGGFPEFSHHSASSYRASSIGIDPSRIKVNPVVSGLALPIAITHAGDGLGRIFIAEKAGMIRILENGVLSPTPFLNMQSIVNSSSNEQGLLALAFHPQYESNGYFYTVHTNAAGSLVLSRFTASPANSNQVNLNSRAELLVIPHPTYTNHNGGTLAFGSDNYLYWSTGDGGGTGDPFNNAQNLTSLLGKLLRLDVNSAFPYAIPSTNPFYNNPDSSIRKEIWAYGLRNPWRFSFDRLTQDLYIGDVGQGAREEIDFQPASSQGGENYGWDVMEGSICYNATTCNQTNKVPPVTEYTHAVGCSVTGGYVYRGPAYPSMQGHYFYGDYCQGILFDLYHSSENGWISQQLLDTAHGISTFGEDENGELYLADYFEGSVYQISYDETTFADVPSTSPYWDEIEILYVKGVTSGCNTEPLMYCPAITVTRDQMAVFLLRARHGSNYQPPAATGTFNDVPAGHWAARWIDELAAEGITSGCGGGNYCPSARVNRAQMAVLLLMAEHGAGYVPPAATGVFDDVPTDHWAAGWIEQLAAEGITSGCNVTPKLYCPDSSVTRDQMAVFLVHTFGLVMP